MSRTDVQMIIIEIDKIRVFIVTLIFFFVLKRIHCENFIFW